MAQFSEQLVEEYFNRQRFLTIRGAKQGVGESDILAIRHVEPKIEALHIEVQTSFRPVAYLSNSNAKWRTDEAVKTEMQIWIQKKYFAESKTKLRESVWPNADWQMLFVHARLADERELVELQNHQIKLITFADILKALVEKPKKGEFTASSGGDVSEILRYFQEIIKEVQ